MRRVSTCLLIVVLFVLTACSPSNVQYSRNGKLDVPPPEDTLIPIYKPYQPTPQMKELVTKKQPISVWENRDETRVYRVDLDTGTLTLIEKFSHDSYIQSSVFVGFGAVGVIANREDTVAYITNMTTGMVTAVQIDNKKIKKSINIGNKPYCMIFNKNQSILYVASRLGDRVYMVEPVGLELIGETSIHDLDLEVKYDQCSTCHESRNNGRNLYLQARHEQKRTQPVLMDWLKSDIKFDMNVYKTGLR